MSQTVNYTRHTILLKCQVLTTCLSKLNLKRVESRLGGIGTKIRCDMRSSSGLSENQQKNWRFENVDAKLWDCRYVGILVVKTVRCIGKDMSIPKTVTVDTKILSLSILSKHRLSITYIRNLDLSQLLRALSLVATEAILILNLISNSLFLEITNR